MSSDFDIGRLTTRQINARSVREFFYLAPFFFTLIAATALITLIMGWNQQLPVSVVTSVLLGVSAAHFYRSWSSVRVDALSHREIERRAMHLKVISLATGAGLSFITVRLMQHVTQTELVLLVNLILIVITIATLCLYAYPRVALAGQLVMLSPTCISLLMSGERTNYYLAGIALLLAGLLHIMLDGFAKVVAGHAARADRLATLAKTATDDADNLLSLSQPFHIELASDERIVSASADLCELLHTPEHVIIGAPITVLMDCGDAETASATIRIQSMMDRGACIRGVDLLLMSPDGATYPVKCTGMPIRNSDDRCIGYRVWFTDLSDLTRLKSEADRAAERIDDFAEMSAEAFWETDCSGAIQLMVGHQAIFGDEGHDVLAGLLSGTHQAECGGRPDASTAGDDGHIRQVVLSDGRLCEITSVPVFDRLGTFCGHRGRAKIMLPGEISMGVLSTEEKIFRPVTS